MLPGVTFGTVPLRVASNCITRSVCSNETTWLFNIHVIVGVGAPTDRQDMLALPPSSISIVKLVRTVVLASSEEKNKVS